MVNRTHARWALGIIGAWELGAGVGRFRERQEVFALAQARAAALGRPLVVVGDPDAGAQTKIARAYGCGDKCLDLTGCPQCAVGKAVDITKGTTPVPPNSAVVFCSCVLEYVPDAPAAVAELRRMAGSDANLFVVGVQPWTLTARLYPGAQWTAANLSAPQPVTAGQKLALWAALGWLCRRAL